MFIGVPVFQVFTADAPMRQETRFCPFLSPFLCPFLCRSFPQRKTGAPIHDNLGSSPAHRFVCSKWVSLPSHDTKDRSNQINKQRIIDSRSKDLHGLVLAFTFAFALTCASLSHLTLARFSNTLHSLVICRKIKIQSDVAGSCRLTLFGR